MTEERRPQGGSMTDMREIYLTPFLDLKIGPNTPRNWPKSRENLVPKFDEAERKGIKRGSQKKCERALYLIKFALNWKKKKI